MVFSSHSANQAMAERFWMFIHNPSLPCVGASLGSSVNPNLVVHGERSEAPQYNGQLVVDEWSCSLRRSMIAMLVDAAKISADLRGGAFLTPSPVIYESAP